MTRSLSMLYSTLYLLLGWTFSTVQSFFVLPCGTLTGQRVDPIISPNSLGEPSGHVHVFAGGTGLTGDLNYKKTQSSTCSSCPVPQDKSNYWRVTLPREWAPHLFFHHKTRGFIATPPPSFQIYYKFEAGQDFSAFPKDFGMIGGSSAARVFNPDNPAQYAVTWKCIDTNEITNGFPKQPCKNGARAQVSFPQCGTGEPMNKDKTHTAYFENFRELERENGGPGKCPPTHPIKYPRIFLEIYYTNSDPALPWGEGVDHGGQPYVLANGDATGFGMHADFFMGWEEGVLEGALKRCDGVNPADGNNADGRAFLCFPDAVKEGVPPPVCTKPGDSPDLAVKEKVFRVDLPKLLGDNAVEESGAIVEYNKPGLAPSGFTTTTASIDDNTLTGAGLSASGQTSGATTTQSGGSQQPEGGSTRSYTPPVHTSAEEPKHTPKPKKPKKPKHPKPHRPKKTPERVRFEPTFAAQQSGNGKGHDLTITTPVTITVTYTQH